MAALPVPVTGQVPPAARAGQRKPGLRGFSFGTAHAPAGCASPALAAGWRARAGPARPGTCMAGGSGAAMRVAGWAGPRAVHVGPAADPGPAGSSGRCGGWGAAMAAGPGAASAPGSRAGGAPRVPATPWPGALAARAAFPRFLGGTAGRGPGQRSGIAAGCGERGARRHRAGRHGSPRCWQ